MHLVAACDGHVVAVSASTVVDAEHAEVVSLYVHVGHQRLGIGRGLLEVTIDHHKSRGIPALQIAVLETNEPAQRFYESMGGRIVGVREHIDGREVLFAWDL